MGSANTVRATDSSRGRDLYDVLGVDRYAGAESIKLAYRRLARQFHPDVSHAPDAEERFHELSAAYAVLSDSKARLLYDRYGYRGRGHGFRPGAHRPGHAPVVAEVDLDAFEALRGARRAVRYSSRKRCSACAGEGSAPGSERVLCATCAGRGRLTRSASLGIGDWLQVEA